MLASWSLNCQVSTDEESVGDDDDDDDQSDSTNTNKFDWWFDQ